jgi:putative protease
MRKYNNVPLELLAPAGNFEIFKDIVKTDCDAVYYGGKSLNMRMIRKGFNFSDDELKEAVNIGRANGKKSYITVNNLVSEREITEAKRFLNFLAEIKPDALIVQDMAIIKLIDEMSLPLNVHSSVMMNVHNIPMIKHVQKLGVSRVVLSREMTLEQARFVKDSTGIETEYFTHGDMCIAHGAQCYHSSYVYGMSSNRGKCLKPCRWAYQTKDKPVDFYPMAVKDMSMYQHLPEMIQAGITSFKIEGRMRETAFITNLISQYAAHLDRYITSPETFDPNQEFEILHKNRKRDFSTGYAFGVPGRENLNERFEGTGKFYSTGKVFSVPTREKLLNDHSVQMFNRKALQSMQHPVAVNPVQAVLTKLSVKVNRIDQAIAAIGAGVDYLWLAGDIYAPDKPFTKDELEEIYTKAKANQVKVIYGTPRMLWDEQIEIQKAELVKILDYCDGFGVGNIGTFEAFKSLGKPLYGDYSFNVYNSISTKHYLNSGLKEVCASIELKADELIELLKNVTEGHASQTCEGLSIIVYGHLDTMYFEHDFYEAEGLDAQQSILELNHAEGTFKLYRDQLKRNHLMTETRLDLLPIVPSLLNLGIRHFKIEAQTESPEMIKQIISKSRQVLAGADYLKEDTANLGYSMGALAMNMEE